MEIRLALVVICLREGQKARWLSILVHVAATGLAALRFERPPPIVLHCARICARCRNCRRLSHAQLLSKFGLFEDNCVRFVSFTLCAPFSLFAQAFCMQRRCVNDQTIGIIYHKTYFSINEFVSTSFSIITKAKTKS